MRNTNIPPKPKYVKINRVKEKEERMNKFADVIEQEKKITAYQLQKILGFGDGIFYKTGQAVLQAWSHRYSGIKGVWSTIEGPVKTKELLSIDWDSNKIPNPFCNI